MTFKVPENDNRLRHQCQSCHHIFYENPKTIVGVLPYFKNQVLLCKRAIEPQKGLWTLPAGFMEIGESFEEGALREAREEVGIEPVLKELFCMYQVPKIGQHYLIFLGEMNNKYFQLGPETSEAKWVDIDKIDFESLAFTAVSFVFKNFQKWQESPGSLNLPIFEIFKP